MLEATIEISESYIAPELLLISLVDGITPLDKSPRTSAPSDRDANRTYIHPPWYLGNGVLQRFAHFTTWHDARTSPFLVFHTHGTRFININLWHSHSFLGARVWPSRVPCWVVRGDRGHA